MAFNFGNTNNANKPAGGFSFGTSTPATGTTFGSAAPAATGFGGFGTTPAATNTTTPATGFGGFGAASTTPATGFGGFGNTSTAPTSTAPAAASTGFGGFGTTPATSTAAPAAASTGFGGFSFGNTSTATSTPATGGFGTTAATPASTGFGGFSLGNTSTATSTPSFGFGASTAATSTPAAGGFGFGGAAAKPALTLGTSTPAVTTTPTVSTTTTPSFGGFGQKSQAPATTSTVATTTPATTSSLTTQPAATTPAAPVSVPTPSTLKNKSMEDVLNKWTKELEKQSKEFHKQACQVAAWDQQLIENGNKISVLHDNVTKVEVTQREIDENLNYINAQQDELNSILDSYEKQIKDIFDESNLQQPMQPADIQREKAYGLAESLNAQLDDINKNLNIMVEDINKMGNTKQISVDDDDVVGQIVQILNSHLSSLQWIDSSSMKLQNKIQEVTKLQEEVVRDQESSLRR